MIAVTATVVTMLPALYVMARFAFRDVILTGDFAVIDARVRDVWQGHVPLVGPYSNGWSHPGPLYFYVLAPLNRLFDGAPWTIVVGGSLLHVVAIGLSARLAWRRGGLSLTLLVLATLALATLGSSSRVLLDPWNPHVAMLFFVLFVLQVWSVMVGDRWQLLGAAIVGTFLVQTHLGYAPIVGTALAAGLVCVVVDARRARMDLRPWLAPLLVSVGTAVVLWLPPVYEQLTGDPGNATRTYRYFRDSPEGALGLAGGARTFAGLYAPFPGWLGGSERDNLLGLARQSAFVWLLVPTVLLVASLAIAWRRRLADVLRLDLLVTVCAVTGMVALSRVKEGAWTYMSLWRIPLAILVGAAFCWTVWRAWTPKPPHARTAGIVVVLAAIVGGVVPTMRDIARTDHVASLHDDAAAVLDQAVDAPVRAPVVLRTFGIGLRGITEALVDRLDRDGVDVRVPPERGLVWGSHRVGTEDDAASEWIVLDNGVRGALLSRMPGARVVAHTTPLAPREEREITRLQLQIADQLIAAGRPDLVDHLERPELARALVDEVGPSAAIDPAALDRIAGYTERLIAARRCRCWVVAFPADAVPAGVRP